MVRIKHKPFEEIIKEVKKVSIPQWFGSNEFNEYASCDKSSFHPTMVRIKLGILKMLEYEADKFPSHNGSDQTQSVDEAIELYLKFPSHNGSDQTGNPENARIRS